MSILKTVILKSEYMKNGLSFGCLWICKYVFYMSTKEKTQGVDRFISTYFIC